MRDALSRAHSLSPSLSLFSCSLSRLLLTHSPTHVTAEPLCTALESRPEKKRGAGWRWRVDWKDGWQPMRSVERPVTEVQPRSVLHPNRPLFDSGRLGRRRRAAARGLNFNPSRATLRPMHRELQRSLCVGLCRVAVATSTPPPSAFRA